MNRTWSALAAAVALGSLAGSAMAQSPAGRVDLTLKDAELLSALQALALQSGLEFSIQVNDQDTVRRVTVKISDRTPEEAIRYICEAAGVTVEKDETGVFIVRTKTAAPTASISAAPHKKPVMRVITLMKADPKLVYRSIVYGDVPDSVQEVEDLNRMKDALDLGPKMTNYGLPRIAEVNPAVNQANPVPTGLNSETFAIPGETSGQRSGGAGLGGGLGGGGQFGGQPGGGQGLGGGGQLGGQGAGGGLGLQGGQGFVPEGITRLSYDPVTNSIVVQGDETAIRDLERIIEMFDVAPKQVAIDVKYITTSNSRDRSLGIDWLYQRGGVFAGNRPGTFARADDPIFVNYATGNITTRLRTLLSDGWGRVVNNPRVTTMNNQPAFFQAQTATTIFLNQIVTTNNSTIIAPQPQQVTLTSGVSVRPRINNDGTVSMIVTTTLSDFGQVRRAADGTEIPDFLTQSVYVAVRVKSGETVALGGLNRKLDNFSRSRIPVLSDLPIIGQLFQGRNEQTSTQDLTIFLTPTILEDTTGAFTP